MSVVEIVLIVLVFLGLSVMVWATRQAAAARSARQDSADAGSSWTADFGDGDGGGD